jgi:hypothetical protein
MAANIKDRVAVKQIAFEFSSSVRVFKCDQIEVTSEEDRQEWTAVNAEYVTETKCFFLDFAIESAYFKEQISGTACDRTDILNALNGTGNVYFYPIYDVDSTVKYRVKPRNGSAVRMLRTEETIFKKSFAYKMRAASGLATYPSWLNFK